MGKLGGHTTQSVKNLYLGRGVCDVVLAANDVSTSEVNIVQHTTQSVQITSIGSDQDWITQVFSIEKNRTPYQIIPGDLAGLERKAPVGLATLTAHRRHFFGVMVGGIIVTIIDERLALQAGRFAHQIQFTRFFVTGIQSASINQAITSRVIVCKTLRLLGIKVPV